MTHDPDDVVRVATGSLTEVEFWREALEKQGIQARVVGDNSSAGFGSALPDSVELWVHQIDVELSEKAILAAKHSHTAKPHTDA